MSYRIGWDAAAAASHPDSQPGPAEIAIPLQSMPAGDGAGPSGAMGGVTIVMDPHGRPLRTIIQNGGKRITGFYASLKAGTAMPYESFVEQNGIYRWEVDTNVVDYRTQPHRVEWHDGQRKRRYTPDVACDMADGSVEIIEIKGTFSPELDPVEAARHDFVRSIYARLGFRFRIVRACEIERPATVFANRAIVQRSAHVQVPADRTYAALDLLAAAPGGVVALGRLAEVLGGSPLGVARACALMVRRKVAIDLTTRFGPNSPVRRVETFRPAGAPTFHLLQRLQRTA